MESEAKSQGPYQVKVTPDAVDDLKDISSGHAETLLALINDKLARAPEHFGEPLKGYGGKIWKLKPGKYRVLYLIRYREKDVHVLAIRNRDHVYKPRDLKKYMKEALVILTT